MRDVAGHASPSGAERQRNRGAGRRAGESSCRARSHERSHCLVHLGASSRRGPRRQSQDHRRSRTAARRAGKTGRTGGRRWPVPGRASPTFCRTRQYAAGRRSPHQGPRIVRKEKLAQEPENTALAMDLFLAYQLAGRTREAIPYLAKASAANPSDYVTLPEGCRSPGVVRTGEGTRRHPAADPRVRQGHQRLAIRPNARPRRAVSCPPPTRRSSTRRWPSLARG